MEAVVAPTAGERLETSGYRLTRQRQMILSVLLQNEGRHFTAEELHRLVMRKYSSSIGIATIYRNLIILHQLGIVEKLEVDGEVTRYEISHGMEDARHHHLVCVKCGAIIGMQENLINEVLKESILEKYDFSVKDNKINLYGYCRYCQP